MKKKARQGKATKQSGALEDVLQSHGLLACWSCRERKERVNVMHLTLFNRELITYPLDITEASN